MTLLILGLVLFLGAHTFTTLRQLRQPAIARLGEGPYKGLYSLVSAAGIVLIVIGFGRYRHAGYIAIWDPPPGLHAVTLILMWVSFVSLAAAYSPLGKIKAHAHARDDEMAVPLQRLQGLQLVVAAAGRDVLGNHGVGRGDGWRHDRRCMDRGCGKHHRHDPDRSKSLHGIRPQEE